jgi:hypothetical protein
MNNPREPEPLRLIMCPYWENAEKVCPGEYLRGTCQGCGAEIGWRADNAERMTKEKMTPLCIACVQQISVELAGDGNALIYRGQLVRNKTDLERAEEN